MREQGPKLEVSHSEQAGRGAFFIAKQGLRSAERPSSIASQSCATSCLEPAALMPAQLLASARRRRSTKGTRG